MTRKQNDNTAPGDASTEGLPKRINKTERYAAQATAARREQTQAGFAAGGRPGRESGGDWESNRNH